MFKHQKHLAVKTAFLSFTWLLSSFTLAHTVWLEPINHSTNQFRVFFGGHAGQLEAYDPNKLKTVSAVNQDGQSLNITQQINTDGIQLTIDGEPSLIAVHFDNGFFSYVGDSRRSIEKPMKDVPGATRGTRAVKYHKTIVAWSAQATKALGQPFEVVILDKTAPQANQPMRVQVLKEGQPVAGVRLGRGEEGTDKDPVTNEEGIAEFIPHVGFNKLWAGKRYPETNNPDYTELSYEFLLGFHAR